MNDKEFVNSLKTQIKCYGNKNEVGHIKCSHCPLKISCLKDSTKENSLDWWDRKLYSERIKLVEKYYPHLFHIITNPLDSISLNMINDIYDEEIK